MNVIYARMTGYDWVSTPSDAVARELEKLGHDITIVENISYIPPKKYDFVWSPYESVIILGDAISKKLNIPHYAHIEWFPPWRIFKDCDVTQYGLDKNDPELQQIDMTISYYEKVGKAFLDASIKSISGECLIPYHERFLKTEIDSISIRHSSIDIDTIEKAKKMFSPKKIPNRVISISRLVPNKRWDLMVKVMNEVRTNIEWCVIGDGPVVDYIKKEANNQNVTLNFLGALWGWNKFYELMKATIFLGSWTGMPPIEAAILGVLPLIIEPEITNEIKGRPLKEHFSDSIFMSNNINEIADKIIKHIESDGSQKEVKDIKNDFLENKMGVTTSEINAKNLIKNMENYL